MLRRKGFTFEHDFAEDGRVPGGCGAVPLVVVELFLALGDADLGAPDHRHHHVRVRPAQLPLASDQTRDVITDDASADQRQRLHRQLT